MASRVAEDCVKAACGYDNNAVPRTCTIYTFFSKCPDKPYS